MYSSDDTILSTEFLPHDPESGFLKFSIRKFFENEDIEAILPQVAICNAINTKHYRFITACLSRRTGKTYVANRIAFLKMLEPGASVLIISPNYSLSGISWQEQIDLFDKYSIVRKKENTKDKEIILENGSFLKLASVRKANSAVGRSYDLILFDECALDDIGKDAFNVTLRPTLDKPNSKCIFISTPRGHNYFHEFFNRGWDDSYDSWYSIHSTWKDNPRADIKDIEDAKREMTSAEFEQEYEANFTIFEGQVYEEFDRDKHVRDLSDINWETLDHETIVGIDPGYRDHTGGVVIKYSFMEEKYYIIRDYKVNKRDTGTHAKTFASWMDLYNVDNVFVDSAAAQFRQDLMTMYDIPSAKAKKSQDDGISFIQNLLLNDKIVVDESCMEVIDMFTNYRWNTAPGLVRPKPLHCSNSHVADALRYALYSYIV